MMMRPESWQPRFSTWGQPTAATHNSIGDLGFRFLYVGAADVQLDNAFGLGLTYMHARHYSSALGRFLQPDPSRLDEHLYVYVGNGPVARVDPSGTWYVRRTYFLHRPAFRRASYRTYSYGRMSYKVLFKLYSARVVYFVPRSNPRALRFILTDSCPGAAVAGFLGLVAMGVVDAGFGVATIFVAPSVVGAVVMVPLDVAAFALTLKMADFIQQSTSRGCTDIRW